jgi:hypothetical protein
MKRLCLYFSLGVAIQTTCFAEVTKLSTEHREALQDFSRKREVLGAANLPRAIVGLCTDDSGRLAEPGRKWEATDAITDASLPQKRLIWAAVSGDYYVVHYERGGRGHSFHVVVATLAKGDTKPKSVWRGVGGRLKNYEAFLSALRKGELDDRLDYGH